MLAHIRKLVTEKGKDSGASAVEYALLVVAIALIMVVGAFALGKAINSKFQSSATCVNSANSNTTSC